MSNEPIPSLGNLLLNATTSDATLRELLRVPTTTETQDGSYVTGDKAPRSPRTPGEEESLEWHEVIELQAFSERKAWIEEKIKVQSTHVVLKSPYYNASSFWSDYHQYKFL